MRRFRLPLALLAVILVAAVVFWLASTSRAATETPAYTVIRTDKECEIRDYPALTVAMTPMADGGMDSSFGQLFGFITGANAASEKIAMTSPVLVEPGKTMSFIMPANTVVKGVPEPSGKEVKLEKMEAARMAILRFSGGRTPENEKTAITKLTGWLAANGILAQGGPLFAYYDPPWTPTFLRRNEVMVRIARDD